MDNLGLIEEAKKAAKEQEKKAKKLCTNRKFRGTIML